MWTSRAVSEKDRKQPASPQRGLQARKTTRLANQ